MSLLVFGVTVLMDEVVPGPWGAKAVMSLGQSSLRGVGRLRRSAESSIRNLLGTHGLHSRSAGPHRRGKLWTQDGRHTGQWADICSRTACRPLCGVIRHRDSTPQQRDRSSPAPPQPAQLQGCPGCACRRPAASPTPASPGGQCAEDQLCVLSFPVRTAASALIKL